MAGATEISIDAAIKAVLSELDGILILGDLKKTPLRPFVVNNAFSPYSWLTVAVGQWNIVSDQKSVTCN